MSTHVKSANTEVDSLGTGRVSIGTSATRIAAPTGIASKFGVVIRADPANTEPIYVGKSTVTPGTVEATDGFPLYAGEQLSLPIGNPREIWAIAPSTTQTAFAVWT